MPTFNLGLAFGLELAALAAFGLWGAQTGPNLGVRVRLGVGAPLLLAIFWGFLLSPRAVFSPPPTLRWSLKLLIFAAAGGAFVAVRQPVPGMIFAGSVALYLVLLRLLPPSELSAFGASSASV